MAGQKDVLQLRSSKQDRADLFYSEAFIYGPLGDVALGPNSSKTVVATHPTEERSAKAGDVIWMPGEEHLPENVGDTKLELILVEIKR